ncbi:unnamed protein product [Phaedon cochleariae]|uniref:15-hydroxyprostaglandin dehydrogenase [NAD(+)]-like n=1 Tax=Phaedon cochleariae TaxID=80249 RepID=A0A9N9SAB4_PHACE|nr:unnamed protein product [Phaedon cochleariae]
MALSRTHRFQRFLTPALNSAARRTNTNASQTSTEGDPEKLNLEEKVAVITGGASGIGYAIAKQFLKEGMSALSIIDINKEKSEEQVKLLTEEFGEDKVLFSEGDVSDADQMDAAFRNTALHYQSIDIIVNNAGILDDTLWEKELNTNLRGCVIGTLLGMQYMAKSSSGEGGIIVNIGSIMSVIPSSGFPIYTMTQSGIYGFTRALGSSSLYSRTGVKMLCYCPSLTDTELLKDTSDKCINYNFANEFQEEIASCTVQKPENVAKGLVSILGEAEPGSIWIVENDQDPYEIEFPGIVKKKKMKADDVTKQEQQM